MRHLSVIGLGAMGSALATTLLKGHRLESQRRQGGPAASAGGDTRPLGRRSHCRGRYHPDLCR